MSERNSKGGKRVTQTPHDLVFKQFLTHPETARDFMQLHLPKQLQALCDLSTLKLESGSFVEESLCPYFSDVLYSLKASTGDAWIHVLIEHQSTPDKHMALRLLRYAVAAMQRHLDAGKRSCRWLFRYCFIPAGVVPILIPSDGLTTSTIQRWRRFFTAGISHWSM